MSTEKSLKNFAENKIIAIFAANKNIAYVSQ